MNHIAKKMILTFVKTLHKYYHFCSSGGLNEVAQYTINFSPFN